VIEELSDYVIDNHDGQDAHEHGGKGGHHLSARFAMLAEGQTEGRADLVEERGPGDIQSVGIIQVGVEPERIWKLVYGE